MRNIRTCGYLFLVEADSAFRDLSCLFKHPRETPNPISPIDSRVKSKASCCQLKVPCSSHFTSKMSRTCLLLLKNVSKNPFLKLRAVKIRAAVLRVDFHASPSSGQCAWLDTNIPLCPSRGPNISSRKGGFMYELNSSFRMCLGLRKAA